MNKPETMRDSTPTHSEISKSKLIFHSLSMEDINSYRPHLSEFQSSKPNFSNLDTESNAEFAGDDNVARVLYMEARKARLAMNQRKSEKNLIASCVFGGESAVHNVFCNHKVMPLSVFIAEDIPIPSWLEKTGKAVHIIRCPQPAINTMLSARKNENYAGHFPAPAMPTQHDLVQVMKNAESNKGFAPKRVLVLSMIRDPMNLGHLIRAASSFGFQHIILLGCASIHNEKLIRASEGVIYDPSLLPIEIVTPSGTHLDMLADLAHAANLHACFAVPNQEAQSVTHFARTLREMNKRVDSAESEFSETGVMLFLGSEHHGLQSVVEAWKGNEPDYVSVKMDNPTLDSLNVAHAGSILMHALRAQRNSRRAYLTTGK